MDFTEKNNACECMFHTLAWVSQLLELKYTKGNIGMSWSAVIEQDGRVVFDAPLILNFLAIM